MKLSLTKKLGWTHVRGGELVRVMKPHAVQTNTVNVNQKKYCRPDDDTKWIYCEDGDLALEIVNVKGGRLIAHSYLSGPAIQLARYTPPQDDWFTTATIGTATIPQPTDDDHGNAFIECLVGAMMDIKYGGIDVVAYRGRARDFDEAHGQMAALINAWRYGPAKDAVDAPVCTTHLIGIIEQRKKKKGGVLVHFQPPHHASDLPASIFQSALVLSAAEYASRK